MKQARIRKMTPNELIKSQEEKWSEWLEMAEQPAIFLNYVLAHQVLALQSKIEYLEKLRDVRSSR